MSVFRPYCNDDTWMALWSTGWMVTAGDQELNLSMQTGCLLGLSSRYVRASKDLHAFQRFQNSSKIRLEWGRCNMHFYFPLYPKPMEKPCPEFHSDIRPGLHLTLNCLTGQHTLYEITELFWIVEWTGTYISSDCITLHAVIILYDNSQLSLPASIPPCLWAANLVATVKDTKDADRKLTAVGFQIK